MASPHVLEPYSYQEPYRVPYGSRADQPKLSVPHSLKISLRRVPIRHHQLAVMSRFLIVHLDSSTLQGPVRADAAIRRLGLSNDCTGCSHEVAVPKHRFRP